ncbi:MAG: hypothetical protein ACYDAD_03705 [Acidimicrobiales bacterium]
MLSPLDDFPVHQVAEPMRHVGTSDPNFYDRYYFNCHHRNADLFLVVGMGQYPNLGVQDGFAVVRRGDLHRVVRASRELGTDRMDTTVGPLRVEVLEGLRRLRVVCEPNEWGLEFDLSWEGSVPAIEEPRHYRRQHGRVTFDTMRLAQTGRWTGRLRVGDENFEVDPGRWWGSRDRSWGVRPVGDPEPPGIRASVEPEGFFWIYAPMQFEDFSIFVIVQETSDGTRVLEEAVKVPASGPPVRLGRPEHELSFARGTRQVERATLRFRDSDLVVDIEPLLPLWVGVGTGYGFDADWRHGKYQGPLVVEGLTLDLTDPDVGPRLFGLVDSVARFRLGTGNPGRDEGWGLFEYAVIGPHDRYGFTDWGT